MYRLYEVLIFNSVAAIPHQCMVLPATKPAAVHQADQSLLALQAIMLYGESIKAIANEVCLAQAMHLCMFIAVHVHTRL